MMKIKQETTHKKHQRHLKRILIISAGALLLIALGTYAFLSYRHWSSFEEKSRTANSSLKTAIDESLGSESPQATPATQIETITAHFNESYGDSPCESPTLYAWQTILPAIKSIETACTDRSASALAVVEALKPLSQFLTDQKIAAASVNAATDATKDTTDYTAAAATWQEVGTTLPTNEHFTATANKITEVTASISAAYSALTTASSNEDRTAFDAAIESLQTAYATIPAIHTTALETQTALVTTVIDTYEKL